MESYFVFEYRCQENATNGVGWHPVLVGIIDFDWLVGRIVGSDTADTNVTADHYRAAVSAGFRSRITLSRSLWSAGSRGTV